MSKLKIIVPSDGRCSNNYILKYFPKNYRFYKNKLVIFGIKSMSLFSFITLHADEYLVQPRQSVNAFNLLSGQYKHFTLDQSDVVWLEKQIMTKYNLNTDWFVLIHNRTDDYSLSDSETQSYRNCNVENYNAAVDYIISLGGTVFWIGDDHEQTLKPRLYFYDVRTLDHSRLQTCLCAKCDFLLGCSSGAAFMATFFGKPIALANLLPVTTMPFTKNDLGLHKHIIEIKSGQKLSVSEALKSSVADGFVSSMYGVDYKYIENEDNEILRLASAMIDQLGGYDIKASSINYNPADYAYGSSSRVVLINPNH